MIVGIPFSEIYIRPDNCLLDCIDNRSCSGQILGRVFHIMTLPLGVVALTLEVAQSIFFGLAMLVTLGGFKLPSRIEERVAKLPSQIFLRLLAVINLNIDGKRRENDAGGILTSRRLEYWINEFASRSGFWERHCLSRLATVACLVVFCATKIADFAIGCVAAVFALLSLGMFDPINDLAYDGLQITQLIPGSLWYLTAAFNPHNFFKL